MIAVLGFRPWIAIWGPLVARVDFRPAGGPLARGLGALAAHPGVNRHYYFVTHVIYDDTPVARIAYAHTSTVFLESRRAHTGSRMRLADMLVTRAHEPIDV